MSQYETEEINAKPETKEINATLDWYVTKGASTPRPGSKVTPLYCGEHVYGEIEKAIKSAKQSIDIVFWRLKYSTRLTTSSDQTILELLQEKSKQGVKVRVLLNKLTNFTNSDFLAKHAYQVMQVGSLATNLASSIASLLYSPKYPNLEVIYRGFSSDERDHMTDLLEEYNIEEYSEQELALTKLATHHQKMVLVDCEDKDNAKAFVLGLNMSPEYRDSLNHYYNYNPDALETNWQDLGSMVEGPIIQPIYWHFLEAWSHTKGEQLNIYPNIQYTNKGSHAPQFCCTQAQQQKTSILKSYEKAIGNAHNYIYMENQYFRYTPIAELIKKRALELQNAPRLHKDKPNQPLYLFVITHYEMEMAFASTMETYKMMNSLGQQQLMPKMQRNISGYSMQRGDESLKIETTGRVITVSTMKTEEKERLLNKNDDERIKKIDNVEDLKDPDKYDVEGKDGKPKPFEIQEIEGLKVIVGALYTDSSKTQSGETIKIKEHFYSWSATKIEHRGITLHSKLMLVDDLFTTIGSANMHARGFLTDSEANISVPDHDIAYGMRTKLWKAHTNKSYDNASVTSSAAIQCDTQQNFNHWNTIMNQNWRLMGKGEPLIAHLVRFWNDQNDSLAAID